MNAVVVPRRPLDVDGGPRAPSRSEPRGSQPLTLLFEAPLAAVSAAPTVSGAAAASGASTTWGASTGSPARADREPRGGLPEDLARAYAGRLTIPLRLDRPTVIANFVTTIDGAVALDRDGRTGGGEISGFSRTDRFVMGLLRAMADIVLVGAGTARASEGTGWTPGRVFPPAAPAYADLRRRLGLAPEPTALIVTGHGRLDPAHPAFHEPDVPVVVAAPPAAAERLRGLGLPARVRVEALGDGGRIEPAELLGLAERLGARLVLSEGGPHLIGSFVEAGLLDELFLTIAPQLVGRDAGADRLSLIEGVGLSADRASWADLVSVRRAGQHLFLRYRFENGAAG